jgi:hypothetical protein
MVLMHPTKLFFCCFRFHYSPRLLNDSKGISVLYMLIIIPDFTGNPESWLLLRNTHHVLSGEDDAIAQYQYKYPSCSDASNTRKIP